MVGVNKALRASLNQWTMNKYTCLAKLKLWLYKQYHNQWFREMSLIFCVTVHITVTLRNGTFTTSTTNMTSNTTTAVGKYKYSFSNSSSIVCAVV